ncbi:MAG TPA: hypothetical protein PLL72_03805 [Burkholderiaceae bacterium]|nr:hypothetical protein [Burkholderiaceae bacterium]
MGAAEKRVDDRQVAILRTAVGARPVKTAAAPSVFHLADRQKRSAAGAAPNPQHLGVVPGRPPAKKRYHAPSAWQAVWDSIPPGGDGRKMTPEQARNLAAWARAHGHTGKMERRQISAAECHVWRKAEA